MDIRLIALDLDGTLLDRAREIPERNLQALRDCEARGIRVALASGRSFESVRRLAIRHGLGGPIVSNNGARLDLSPDGPMLVEHPFPRGLAVQVFELLKQSEIYFTCYGRGTLYQNNLQFAGDKLRGVNLRDRFAMQAHRAEKVVADEALTASEGLNAPYKFVAFTDSQALLARLRASLAASGLPLNISSSWHDNVEIMSGEAGKEVALRELCVHLGIYKQQVMAFGDYSNDMDMLKFCGWPVAMENAVEPLKALARIIAPHHDQCGVAAVLNRYVLGT